MNPNNRVDETAARAAAAEAAVAYDNALASLHDEDGQPITITQALGALAAFFHEAAFDNRSQPVNALGYTQRDILNGLAWKANLSLQQAEDKHEQAAARVRIEAGKADGTEISLNNIDRAIWWAERFELQVNALTEFRDQAEAFHEAVVGEIFKRPTPKVAPTGDAGNPVDRKAMNARLAKYGASVNADQATTEDRRTDGVDVTDAEADALVA